MDDERTIGFTLDKLDFEPNSVFGFTMTEFIQTSMFLSFVFGLSFGVLTSIFLDFFMYGLIGGAMLAVVLASCLAFRGETYKKGRPSYMLWVDLWRFIQFRFNVDLGFINTQVWDTCHDSTENRKK